jgi:hypothetical protein
MQKMLRVFLRNLWIELTVHAPVLGEYITCCLSETPEEMFFLIENLCTNINLHLQILEPQFLVLGILKKLCSLYQHITGLESCS